MQVVTWIGLAVLIAAISIGSSCSERVAVDPEQLLEQQPSGAGLALEVENRPGYLKRSRLTE